MLLLLYLLKWRCVSILLLLGGAPCPSSSVFLSLPWEISFSLFCERCCFLFLLLLCSASFLRLLDEKLSFSLLTWNEIKFKYVSKFNYIKVISNLSKVRSGEEKWWCPRLFWGCVAFLPRPFWVVLLVLVLLLVLLLSSSSFGWCSVLPLSLEFLFLFSLFDYSDSYNYNYNYNLCAKEGREGRGKQHQSKGGEETTTLPYLSWPYSSSIYCNLILLSSLTFKKFNLISLKKKRWKTTTPPKCRRRGEQHHPKEEEEGSSTKRRRRSGAL